MGEPAEKKEEQIPLGEAERYFYWDGDNLRVRVDEIRKIKGIDALADEPVVGIKKIYGERLLDTIAGRNKKDEQA